MQLYTISPQPTVAARGPRDWRRGDSPGGPGWVCTGMYTPTPDVQYSVSLAVCVLCKRQVPLYKIYIYIYG